MVTADPGDDVRLPDRGDRYPPESPGVIYAHALRDSDLARAGVRQREIAIREVLQQE
jgi:hypothetical protein